MNPSGMCGDAEPDQAHRLMQQHHRCRMDLCAWKWVAYCTLVHHGRVVPPEFSPRERAHVRGIAFPIADPAPARSDAPEPTDGESLYAATTLDEIEHWLNT